MPKDVASGMGRLRRKCGAKGEEVEEDTEICKILRSVAEQRGQLRALMTLFLVGCQWGDGNIGRAVKPFRIRFVRSVWDVLQHPAKTEASYEAFVAFLRRMKLLIE
jgi:hypothetical protein